MVEAYKVGVTFALNNLVSAELLKISEQFAAVNVVAKEFQATLKSMSGFGGAGIFTGMSASATAMGNSFKYAAAEIDGVRARLTGLRQTAAQSSGGGIGFVGGIGAMAAGYTGFESLKSSMSMDDTIARAMIAMGLQVGPNYMDSDVAKRIRSSVFDTSTGFGVRQADTQDAALQAIRSLAPLTPEQRMELLPSIMKFAGAEVLGKHGTTMDEAAEAGIALAHQLRAYSPEQIEPILGAFAKLSMASPQSLSQMARASSYYLPLLTAGLNMDPTELMALGTVGSQMGLNTKAGTWLSRLFQAPFTADLTGKRESSRRSALEALGLYKDGKIVTKDPIEFLKIIAASAGGMTPDERMKDYVAAFGQQGARAAAIYTDPAVMKNLLGLSEGLRTAQTPDALKTQYGNSPLVQFDKTWGQFMKALTTLGDSVTPQAVFGLKMLSKVFEWMAAYFQWTNTSPSNPMLGVMKAALFGGGNLSATPPPAQSAPIMLDHKTILDGRVLAESTTKYQVEGLATVSPSGNNYDLRMTPLVPGY